MTDEITESKLAQQILDYLQDQPEAGDTLEGIARWWVLRQRLSESSVIIGRAVEALKRKGYLEEHKTPDGRIMYFARRGDK
jgi:hypothetical protein